jgi:hypothetical protein
MASYRLPGLTLKTIEISPDEYVSLSRWLLRFYADSEDGFDHVVATFHVVKRPDHTVPNGFTFHAQYVPRVATPEDARNLGAYPTLASAKRAALRQARIIQMIDAQDKPEGR